MFNTFSYRMCVPVLGVFALLAGGATLAAQETAPGAATPALAGYPDGPGGLEKLIKDIFRAAKEGNETRYAALVSSLAQPVPETWYREVFGEDAGPMLQEYREVRRNLDGELSGFFLKMRENKATSVTARKHVATCDDNAGELIYPVLVLRKKPAPLYELRFPVSMKFYRLWAVAYVDSGFRYVGDLHPPEYFPPTRSESSRPDEKAGKDPGEEEKRVKMPEHWGASKIVRRVQPEYPEIAVREHLSGVVKLHALIARDGTVRNLRVLKGYCSLAEAAVKAVRQWRYTPTLVLNTPVEVDTTIEVVFSLSR